MNSSLSPGSTEVMNSTKVSYSTSTNDENTAYTSRPNRSSHIVRNSSSPNSVRKRCSTTCWPGRPRGRSKMCDSDGVGSVDRTSVCSPASARRSAVAAAQVVLPTPPLPRNTRILVPERPESSSGMVLMKHRRNAHTRQANPRLPHAFTGGRMRVSVLVLTALSFVLPAATNAQATPVVLAPNTRIRFTVAPDSAAVVARVVAQHGDSIWVRPERTGDTLSLRASSLARLDVSRGKETHARHAAGVGFLIGAVSGGIFGYATGEDCHPTDWICFPRGETATAGALMFGLLGAGAGAIVGWVMPVERWNHILPPAAGRFTIGPDGRGGRRYGVAFRVSLPGR